MPRSGRTRNFIKECKKSPIVERLSFLPPYIILGLETVLITHAILSNNLFVIVLTAVLVVISVIEIILVSREMREHYQQTNFNNLLTIRLDDFITEGKIRNVKIIVEQFINRYPEYSKHRSQIYRTTCQILETHKVEQLEKDIEEKLRRFINRRKKKTVDEILHEFIVKYPKYKRHRGEIYDLTCKIKGEIGKK